MAHQQASIRLTTNKQNGKVIQVTVITQQGYWHLLVNVVEWQPQIHISHQLLLVPVQISMSKNEGKQIRLHQMLNSWSSIRATFTKLQNMLQLIKYQVEHDQTREECDKKIEAHNKFKISCWYEEQYRMLIMICIYYSFSFP